MKMPFTPEAVTQQVQERLKCLHGLTREIEDERIRGEPNFTNLMKAREKLASGEERRSINQQKMKTMLKEAITDTEKEEELLRKALNKITEIRAIRNECMIQARNSGNKETIRRGTLMKMLQSTAQTLPLFVGKANEKPPPLCGAIPADANYIAKVGDMVAALVKGSEEEEENWILAEVVSYNSTTNKYEVDDIDEEDKDRHILSRRRVVPLPLMRANPETDPHALFPKGSEVMALYPQTTCFYTAVVHQLPNTHLDDYEVLFEDSSYSQGYSPPMNVTQRYVIATKQKNKQA